MAARHPVNDMCHKYLVRPETLVQINVRATYLSEQKKDTYVHTLLFKGTVMFFPSPSGSREDMLFCSLTVAFVTLLVFSCLQCLT